MGKVGGPRVFFDVLGTFNAQRLLADTKAGTTVMEAVILDSVDSIVQSFAGIGQMISNITREVIPMGVALSEATIEFEKFAGRGTEALQENIMKTGISFGLAADDSLRAGAKMAQLSALIGKESIDVATELGQKFALIGGMSTDEAMKGLINLQQQTKFMYGDMEEGAFRHLSAENQRATVLTNTMEAMDQLNTVENTSVATMKQLIFVMNQFAAQAHLTGEGIAEMAAMSAVLIEAGEEQGKAGRALRMIYARLGSNIKDNNDLLKSHGVLTHDANGALRSLSDILEDINRVYPSLTEQQRQNLVQTVAGNDHYVRLVKLIENQERVTELATGALENQATAQEEVNIRLDDASIAYKAAIEEQKKFKADMGRALLPAMTQATEETNLFIQALSELVETPVGGIFASGFLQLQAMSQIFGGFMNAFMQLKSINIAMATHETILKAVNGQEIVRTDNYRKQGLFSGVTLDNQKQTAILLKSIQVQELELASIGDRKRGIELDIEATQKNRVAIGEQLKRVEAELLTLKEHGTHKETARYNARVNAYNLEKKIEIELMKQELGRNVLMKGQLGHHAGILTALERTHAKRVETLSQLRAEVFLHESLKYQIIGYANAKTAALKLDDADYLNKKAIIAEMEKENIQRQKAIATIRAAMSAKDQEQADLQRAAALYDENALAVKSLSLSLDDLAMHTREMDAVLIAYNRALDDMNFKKAQAARLNYENLKSELMHMKGMKTNTLTIDRMTASMTQLSLTAGMASMALTMFTDDADAMKASIFLMMVSMAPAVVQMAAMTLSMTEAGLAAGKTAKEIGVMSVAIKGLAFVAGAGVLALVAYGMVKLFSDSKDATDQVEELNSSLATTTQLLGRLTQEEAQGLDIPDFLEIDEHPLLGSDTIDITKMSFEELNGVLGHSANKMDELIRNRDAYAEDDPMRAYFQNLINELEIFDSQLEQQRSVQLGATYAGLEGDELAKQVLRDIDAGNFGDIEVPILYTYQRQIKDPTYGFVTGEETRGVNSASRALNNFNKISEDGMEFLLGLGQASQFAGENFAFAESAILDSTEAISEGFTTAEEKMRAFANAREELFFGGKSSYMSGDMMKQVVNKGVENLYSNVELVMTNNFYGLTFEQAVSTISSSIVRDLIDMGVPIDNTTA